MDFAAVKSATVDEKGRVVLPADFKNEMGGSIPDGRLAIEIDLYQCCLNIYPMEHWKVHLAGLKERLNINDMEDAQMLDFIYQRFKIVQVPDSCRISLPAGFIEEVHISKDVVFSGQGVRIRLWDAKEFNAYQSSLDSYKSKFAKFFGNGSGVSRTGIVE